MKKAFVGLCMLLALGYCSGTIAAEKKDKEKKEDKKEMKKDAPADGSTISVTGMMAVKSKDAKSDVVCRLTSGNQKMDKVWNLVASGETAKQLEAMRQEGDKVKVTGKVSGDDLAVEKVEKVVYMKK